MWMRISIFVLAAMVLGGCDSTSDSSSSDAPAGKSGPVVAVIPNGATTDYWKSVRIGAEKAGAELGVQVHWYQPPNDRDRGAQLHVIEEALGGKIDAVALAPIDRTSFVDTIAEIHRKMPIVLFDMTASTDRYTAMVSTDNRAAGRFAGEYMRWLLGKDGGEIAMIRIDSGSPAATEREERFKDEMAVNPNLKIVEEIYVDADTDRVERMTDEMLAKRPNLAGIFTSTEASTVGVLRALEDNARAGAVKFIGFDSNAELLRAMDRHSIDGLVVQDGPRVGATTVKAAVEAAANRGTTKDQSVEPKLVTPQNKATLLPQLVPVEAAAAQ